MATIDAQISTGTDDGARYTGAIGFSSGNPVPAFELGYYNNALYYNMQGFWRFQGITIPAGSTIDVAYLQAYDYSGDQSGTPQLKIYGVDEDNPAAPTSAAEFDADPLTAASVDWDGAWTGVTWHTSPSIISIIQELLASYTISGDAMMFQVKNDGGTTQRWNSWYIYETDSTRAPKLHIEYTPPAGGLSVPISTYYMLRGIR